MNYPASPSPRGRGLRIALVCPRLPNHYGWVVRWEPLGLLILATAARRAGHEVQLFDELSPSCFPPDRLIEAIDAFAPDLVGINCTAAIELPRVLDHARALKAVRPNVPVVLGGWHVSSDESAMEDPAVDLVVRGEGERPFLGILDNISAGRPGFHGIDGVTWKEGDEVRRNPSSARLTDLDAAGPPARDLVAPGLYRWPGIADAPPRGQRFFTINATRGCPYGCSFCVCSTVIGKKWVHRPVDRVVDEIEALNREYGANLIAFTDVELSLDRKYIAEFCDEMRSRGLEKRVQWTALLRVTDLTSELAHAMRRAGCCYIFFGLETGVGEGLRQLNKRATRSDIRKGVLYLADADIQTLGSTIIGFPWERSRDLDETLNFLLTLPLSMLGVNFLVPYKGTAVREVAEEDGLIFDYDIRNWHTKQPVMRTRYLSAEELMAYNEKIIRAYYRSPVFLKHWARFITRRPTRTLSMAASVVTAAGESAFWSRLRGAMSRSTAN